MRARKPSCSGRSSSTLASAVWSCSGRSSSTLASAVCQSTFARLRSWRAVPTLLSAASRRTWRADHRGGGRNVDAGGRGRAMSVLVCSKAAIRAVGWTDAEERCREAASTLGNDWDLGWLVGEPQRGTFRHFYPLQKSPLMENFGSRAVFFNCQRSPAPPSWLRERSPEDGGLL